ncbi:hypothetical protein R70723_01805 [Paenibacillus sp. FSL R7-0273]|uniref:DUF5823 family protein n=1 Tax=Paenibacillus sp. FSL R7-0273 TaxID=1536772 RepID=UPI0004F7794C|nr:DUF5823 family protein [Paenibacillus sp. FSL R7-0273]AIQ44777.1 hypothetical protein R70723_01805 [Paenibacillus sp. FSL R7-0273]OMF93360.1 hypothetical protein BK144_11695 [Paenibacillus sp. FSL R7-0273]
MLTEILRVIVNFLIELFSGELPALYYTWIVLLTAGYALQMTLIYPFSKQDKSYIGYLAEGAAGLAVILPAGILISEFFASIIEDGFIQSSGTGHYFISLIITTAFVVVDGFRHPLQKINHKDRRFLLMLAAALAANTLSFSILLPLTGPFLAVSRSFIVTLIVSMSIIMMVLYHFDQQEPSVLSEKVS